MILQSLSLAQLIKLVMSDQYSKLSISEKNQVALLIFEKKKDRFLLTRNKLIASHKTL